MLCSGCRVAGAASSWGRATAVLTSQLFQAQQIRTIYKRIYVAKSNKTLHPQPPTPVTTVQHDSIEHPVIDFFTKQQTGTMQLNREIFGAPLRLDILQRVVIFQLDGRRQGTHKGKTRGEVRGSNRKPWKQKGTGRARIGSIRAPHWRGGGAVFPPVPRDHSTKLPSKLRGFGLKVALSAKLAQGNLHIVETLNLPTHKTKDLSSNAILPKEYGSVMLVDDETVNPNLERAAANIRYVDAMIQTDVNVYDLVSRKSLVITRAAIEKLTERVKNKVLGCNTVRMLRHRAVVAEEIAEYEAQAAQAAQAKEVKEQEKPRVRKKVPKKYDS